MAKRKRDKGIQSIVATAGVVAGLAGGIVVVNLVRGNSGGEARPYEPFFVGTADRVTKQINSEGPVCFQDPDKGDRSFCLDLDGDKFIALHVVPPGGTTDCLVQWDRREKRYEDCRDEPVDRNSLARLPVLTRKIGETFSVFVDVREATTPSAPAR